MLKSICIGTIFDRFCHNKFFIFNRELAKEQRRIANIFQRLLLLSNQYFNNTYIALDTLIIAFHKHIANIGTLLLTIAIDTTVSLLEHHQRPGNVKVNQAMTQIMQVQALGSNIRCNQNTDRRFGPPKIFNNPLLFCITHSARNFLDCICFQAEILAQSFCKILHRLYAFRKDDNAVTGICRIPSIFFAAQQFKKFLITGKTCRCDCFKGRFQFFQQTDIFDVVRSVFFIEFLQSCFDAFDAGRGTGEQRFFQTRLKQLTRCFGFSRVHFKLHLGKNIKSIFFLCRSPATFKGDFSF